MFGLGILVAYYRLRGSISLANDQNSNTTALSYGSLEFSHRN